MTLHPGNDVVRQNARAKERIIAPVAAELRWAGLLSVLSGALWPLQAASLAWGVAEWVAEAPPLASALPAAGLFAIVGLLRATLDHRAGQMLFDAADRTIARERKVLIRREARERSAMGSAGIAAVVVDKLPLLQPWVTRYHVAMTRVRVLPLLLFALTFSLSWIAGLVLLVAGPLIPVFMALVGMAAEAASRRQMDEIGTLNEMTMERLSAMLDIRLLGAEERVTSDFANRADELRRKTMSVLRIAFLSSTVLELFSALGVALVAVFVGFTLLGEINFGSWGTPLTLGEGLFLLLIAPEFFQPLRDLGAAWHDRAAGYAVVDELDRLDAVERLSPLGNATRCAPLRGAFSIKTQSAVVALPGSTIRLPDVQLGPGESLAVTGPSGAGKSTMIAALLGLVPLEVGEIEVCGQVLDDATADAWRQRVAYVPQRPHFSDLTLRDWLDPRGTGDAPTDALRVADADRIVARLPNGLTTRLGETGGGVSGGEARRLMIARAVMMGGDVVFADEPTADLDQETADRVTNALIDFKRQGRALVVATHDGALAAAMEARIEVAA
ncbi:ABC transporter ATP-binding protein/permease [Roseovarius ramblicola]|uniref:ABC transporter ATP-binding protein/permease n=1 Tax=Roseovarius ramblicola TaxID=2022336 RepID=A0ABV5I4E5_9RHOB